MAISRAILKTSPLLPLVHVLEQYFGALKPRPELTILQEKIEAKAKLLKRISGLGGEAREARNHRLICFSTTSILGGKRPKVEHLFTYKAYVAASHLKMPHAV